MNEEEFWAALVPQTKPAPVSYRLYYDEHGNPLFYSMEDLPGKYIEIDRETFTSTPAHVRVVDDKLVILKTSYVPKLKPSDVGTPCDPRDVSVVVSETSTHIKWSLS